jgi:hypothetical protein
MFLEPDQVVTLTGRRQKSAQITQLRKMGVVFFVNASGHPIIAEAAIEGRKQQAKQPQAWSPSWAVARP